MTPTKSPGSRHPGWQGEALAGGGVLHRAQLLLGKRLADLEHRVRQGDEGAWGPYVDTLQALLRVLDALKVPSTYLSTREMARTLGISSKTLLRRRKQGQVKPALVLGQKFIRWRADGLGGRGDRPGTGG